MYLKTLPSIFTSKFSKIFSSKLTIALFIAFFLLVNSAKSQVDLLVTTEATSDGNLKLDSIKTGKNFIFVIDYSISSLTQNGNHVVIKVNLPTNLTIPNGNTSIVYDHSQIASVTNSGGVVTATCVNPIQAGSTGQMQISMLYTNGSTPNGYQPNIITTISGTNANVTPIADTTDIKALASNSITLSKAVKNLGTSPTLYSPFTYTISYANSGGSEGNLNLYHATIVDTLPPDVSFQEATKFTNSAAPTVDSTSYPNHTIVSWNWGNSAFAGSGSANITVIYKSPTYTVTAPSNIVSNCATLNGQIPVTPFIGASPSLADAPPITGCVSSTLIDRTSKLSNPGTGVSSNIPGLCPGTVMAGSTANFKSGWTNAGNTSLDYVEVISNIDKNIDVTSVFANKVSNPVPGASVPYVLVYEYYELNDNPGVWVAVSGSPFDNRTMSSSYPVTLGAGQYITRTKIRVEPGSSNDPIGPYFTQDLTYTGDIRTTSQGPHGSGTIVQGSNNPGTCTVNVLGTNITNCYTLDAEANSAPVTHSNPSCGNTHIVGQAPVFSSLSKSSTNGTSFGPASQVDYEISAKQLGIGVAQNVTWTDVLNAKLSYIPGSAQFKLNNGTYAAIAASNVDTSGQTVTFHLDPVNSGDQIFVKFSTMIADGTPPSSITNQATLASTNSYINAGNPKTNSPTITVISAAAYTSKLGQNGCDTTHFVYYPEDAHATPQGKINYRALLKNSGNVGGNNITLIDVFPYIGDGRGSQYFANLAAPITFSDPSSIVYYDTVSNPCMPEFTPAVNPAGCKTANWNVVPPADITAVKAIKITRAATLAPLDSLVYKWPMILPVGVPTNITMYNSYTYQLSRSDNSAKLLPATPNKVGMITDCISPLGSLGNYAWVDSNRNGLQDEAVGGGINGLKIYLYKPGASNVIGGNDQVLLDSTFTGNDFNGKPGYYTFTNLNDGNYYVKFPAIDGKVFTVKNQTAKTDNNSDADRTSGYSGLVHINVAAGGLDKDNPTIDAGYISCTLNVVETKTNITCSGFGDGKISLAISGAIGTPTILWNDGQAMQNRQYMYPATYSVKVTDSVGCAKTITDTMADPPILAPISGNNNLCIDSTTNLTNSIPGGVWAIDHPAIATLSNNGHLVAKTAGTAIVTYKINNNTCGTAYFYLNVNNCNGNVGGGGGGGLESKSLGDAVAQRVYNKAKDNNNGSVDYSKLQMISPASGTISSSSTGAAQVLGGGNTSSVTLSSIMPDITKNGFVAYNSTPTDIISITNAKEVLATDFTLNQQPKAVAFATKTLGQLYDHSKPICDRLKGASLISVDKMNVGGFDFVKYTIRDQNGTVEYATSFSVGTKTGRNDFSIQSTWLMEDYVSDEVMYNFQLWAASPDLVNSMINDVLNKLKAVSSVNTLSTSTIPATYVVSGARDGVNLNLNILNQTANTGGYFILKDNATEVSNTLATRQIPFTIGANGNTTVSIPMNDLYESNISMYINGQLKDELYMNDGTWSVGFDKNTTSISNFTVNSDANRVYNADEYTLFRNVAIKGTSSDYVSIFKLMKGGAAEADITPYKTLKFTASGGYTLRVMLIKNSIANWADQYYTDIKLDDAKKDYMVSLNSLASAASKDKINANDVTTVVFAVMVNGKNSSINTTLSNVSFTKDDLTYLNNLTSKEVQLYPNPATGRTFNASFYSSQAAQLTLRVTDVNGRTILSKAVNAVKGLNVVPVELKAGTNGIHIVTVDGADAKYNSKKIVLY